MVMDQCHPIRFERQRSERRGESSSQWGRGSGIRATEVKIKVRLTYFLSNPVWTEPPGGGFVCQRHTIHCKSNSTAMLQYYPEFIQSLTRTMKRLENFVIVFSQQNVMLE